MAALHTLSLHDAPADLHFDWARMLAEQHDSCARDMRAGGVDVALVEQVDTYLAATPWGIEQGEIALVQGDLASLNLMVTEINSALTITGLIDWGDAKIGAPSHEFISPGVHMYRGDRNALRHWYEGYQLLKPKGAAEYQHVIMARAMLYYSEDFAKRIEWIPGAAACADWSTMASAFWQMH
jgi:aminoglycoside phosphotransferase (APT) family kinase protein